MKKILTTIIALGVIASASAQMTDHIHNFQFNLGAGFHSLRYTPVDGDYHLGGGGLFEMQYQGMFNHYLGLGVGFQVSDLGGNALYNYQLSQEQVMLPSACYDATVNTRLYNWKEKQRALYASVPLQVILRVPMNVRTAFQVGLGGTLDFPISGKYKATDGLLTREAYMPQTNVTYTNMSNHQLGTYHASERGNIALSPITVGCLVDMGFVFNSTKTSALYLGLYCNYSPANVNASDAMSALSSYDGTSFRYAGTFASDRVAEVHPLECGLKLGLRMGAGKSVDWREEEAAAIAAAQRRADSIAAAQAAAEAARLAAEQAAREAAVAAAKAEAEARAKAQADSLAALHAAEMAKARAEAEAAAKERAEAAAAKAKAEAEAEAARLQAEAEALVAKAKADAEAAALAKAEAEAAAARAKAEEEARALAEAEARARARAEQKAREEVAFVAGFSDTAFFETGKDMPIFGQLNEDSWDNLKDIMDRHPEIKVTVVGHTDNVGKAAANLDLSKRRAENIKKMLVGKGISADRIAAIGKGQTQPIATNGTKEGRAKNRRIVITIGR